MIFVLVAKPEKLDLIPHINFVKHLLRNCIGMKSIYILAAGRNIVVAKHLPSMLLEEFKKEYYELINVNIESHEYKERYKTFPNMPLYLCRIRLFWKT